MRKNLTCCIFIFLSTSIHAQDTLIYKNSFGYSPFSIEVTSFTQNRRLEPIFAQEVFFETKISKKVSSKSSLVYGVSSISDKYREPIVPVTGEGRLKEVGLSSGLQFELLRSKVLSFCLGTGIWGSYYSYKGKFSTSVATIETDKSATIIGLELNAALRVFLQKRLSLSFNFSYRLGRGEMILENPALTPWKNHSIITPMNLKFSFWF